MEPVIPSENSEPPSPSARSGSGFVAELWDICKTVAISFIIMIFVNAFVFNLSMVKGESMEPTLEEGERLFVNKVFYYFSDPKRSDVVVLKDPSEGIDKKPYLVKRVVAVPGDTVEVRDRQLLVNGKAQSEPYTDIAIEDSDIDAIQLGEDEFFVMGDNRHEGRSKDSRYFGAVKRDFIVGHAEFVFWPITKIRGL
ncbi:Signal peptidase I P [compost metagenome]